MIFIQYLSLGVLTGALYGLMAAAIVIIFKATQVFNFAVGTLMTFCALLCLSLVLDFNIPFWLAVPIAIALGGIIGIVVERFGLRPLLAQPLLTLIMATLAIDNILRGVMLMVWGGHELTFPRGLLPGKTILLGPVFLPHEFVYAFVVALICFALVGLFFNKTQTGLKMRVTAESHEVAMSLGINISRMFSLAWMLSLMVGAVAGIFIGSRLGLQVVTTSQIALKAFPAIIFGGINSISGAIIGGFAVGILEKMAAGYIDPKVAEITPYVILLAILLIRPEGLFGIKRIERI